MRDFVPADVWHAIAALEAELPDARVQGRCLDEDAQARHTKIRARRVAHETELRRSCASIDSWLSCFEQTAGPAIWQLAGEGLVLYTARFWNNEPVLPDMTAYSAQLRFEPPGQAKGRLVYEELEYRRVSVRYWQNSALHLWHNLHPDFVLQCAAHIESGRVWNEIRNTLERLRRS